MHIQIRRPQQIPVLSSVRGIAAWWVVLYHFRDEFPRGYLATDLYNLLRHGHLAVDFFFALSGFIIALNYAEKFRTFRLADYRQFLILRLGRIYPLYLFMLILF